MHKKSQVALEFLTTYGWAFLIILIMISTLAYFGVLKPSKLLPDRCNFGTEFECLDFQIAGYPIDAIKIRLKNNVGNPIQVASMTVSTESVFPLICNAPDSSGVWVTGEIKNFVFSACNSEQVGFIPGEKNKVLVKISYYSVRSGEGYTHDVFGEIFATVTSTVT